MFKDLNEKQRNALQQLATNAATVVLGTLILGGLLSPHGFNLTAFVLGSTIYLILAGSILKITSDRRTK